MRKEVLTSVCALALMVGASTAFAGAYGEPVEPEEAPVAPPAPPAVVIEEEPDYARLGPYIGAGGNYAINNFDQIPDVDRNGDFDTNDIGEESSVDNSGGFHVRAGYRVHSHVAVELRYEHFLGFETDPGPGRLEGWMLTGDVKGFFTTGRFQPFAVIGMGYLDLNSPGVDQGDAIAGDDFAMRFGLGLDGHVTENVAMGPEVAYVLPVGDASDLDMITIALGLQYKF